MTIHYDLFALSTHVVNANASSSQSSENIGRSVCNPSFDGALTSNNSNEHPLFIELDYFAMCSNGTNNVSSRFGDNSSSRELAGQEYYAEDCSYEKHQWLETKFFLMTICGTIVAVMGIFGNLTTAFILTTQRHMRTPNNMYLTALAIFDSILLITGIMIYGMEYFVEYTDNVAVYVVWISYLPYVYGISHISQTGSVYTTVAVTIERFLAMVYPKRSRSLCTKFGALTTILGVILFAAAFNASKLWELRLVVRPQCDGFAQIMIGEGPLLQNEYYTMIHGLWLTQLVMVFLPFIALLLFNGIITYSLHQTQRKHGRMSSNYAHIKWNKAVQDLKERSREATIILIVIVVIFLICNFWGFVLTLLEYVIGKEVLLGPDYLAFYTFSRESINFLAITNSSINFIIYCVFGKDFRKEVFKIYCCAQHRLLLPAFGDDKFRQERFDPTVSQPSQKSRRFDRIRKSLPFIDSGRFSKQKVVAANELHSSPRTHKRIPLWKVVEMARHNQLKQNGLVCEQMKPSVASSHVLPTNCHHLVVTNENSAEMETAEELRSPLIGLRRMIQSVSATDCTSVDVATDRGAETVQANGYDCQWQRSKQNGSLKSIHLELHGTLFEKHETWL